MGVRDIKILIYLITFLFVILIVYFLIRPAMVEIKNKKIEIKTSQKILEQKEQTLAVFYRVSAKYKKAKGDIKKMDQILTPEADRLLTFIQLDALASDNKIVLKDISFGELKLSEKGIGVFPTNITVKGTYPDFKDFLEAIAKNLNLMDIEMIDKEKGEIGEEKAGIFTFSLKINVYTKEVPIEEKPEEKPEETEEEILK